MTTIEYIVIYHITTKSERERRYSKRFPNESEAIKYARKKSNDERVYDMRVFKDETETLRPEYEDERGVIHASITRTQYTYIEY